MKLMDVNPDSSARMKLDKQLREPIRAALESDAVSVSELVFILTRMLPEIAGKGLVLGQILAAYDLAAQRGQKPILGDAELPPLPMGSA